MKTVYLSMIASTRDACRKGKFQILKENIWDFDYYELQEQLKTIFLDISKVYHVTDKQEELRLPRVSSFEFHKSWYVNVKAPKQLRPVIEYYGIVEIEVKNELVYNQILKEFVNTGNISLNKFKIINVDILDLTILDKMYFIYSCSEQIKLEHDRIKLKMQLYSATNDYFRNKDRVFHKALHDLEGDNYNDSQFRYESNKEIRERIVEVAKKRFGSSDYEVDEKPTQENLEEILIYIKSLGSCKNRIKFFFKSLFLR